MENKYIDTMIFYAASVNQKKGLVMFKEAVSVCYGTKMSAGRGSLVRIFKKSGIPFNDIFIRSSVAYSGIENRYVILQCVSARNPPYEAYLRLVKSFGISFVLQAEELGFSVYINTDTDKENRTSKYTVYPDEIPEGCRTDDEGACFYFNSDKELMKWLREYGAASGRTVEELRKYQDEECVCIYRFGKLHQ